MSQLEAAVHRLLRHLSAHGVPFAVVGGLAVSARTEPRFTREADVCVAVTGEPEAERLVRTLRREGYEVQALVEQDATGRIATVRLKALGPDEGGVVLDLLFASSGIEAEVVADAEIIELFEGLEAPVASKAALIALKVLARDDVRRPQDRADLLALLSVASAEDLVQADTFARRIVDRGYARGRDLPVELARIEDEARSA